MSTTQIKSSTSDNQAIVDSAGHLYVTDGGQPINVTGSISATNPSVGTNGATAPTSSTEIGGINPNGNLQALSLDSNGAVLVNDGNSFVTENLVIQYNAANSIAIGTETTINTFTAPTGYTSYMLSILVSGENRAQFNIYNNGVLLDTQYTPVTNLSALFDYKTGSSNTPGYVVPIGNVVTVTVINSGTSTANFNSRFMILETT